jgi:Rhodanese-like domain
VPGVESATVRPMPLHSLRVAVRDALLVLVACAAVGAATNALRPGGIAFVQRSEYEILVPCPEGSGDAHAIQADDPTVWDPRTLLVDARSAVEHQRWHPTGAIAVPFDYLEPTSSEQVRRIASSGASRVVVLGDGNNPDSGEQLAREIAGKGIRNVRFVEGGAPLLEKIAAARGAR